ncbi:MAG: hypothetical protein ACYC2Z_06930 [Candidatus Nanopelagicales bacterium]
MAVVSGRQWPSLGSRYEPTTASSPAATAWDTLDQGGDPADDPAQGRPGN